MNEVVKSDVLTNKNYQSALKIINQLGDCQTREALNQVIKTALIPLLACHCALYVRLQRTQTIQLLDSINQSLLCANGWQCFLKITQRTQLLASPLTCDLTTQLATDRFTCSTSDHPSYFQADSCCTVLAMFDASNPTFACYFCRINAQVQPYSPHELNLFRLLRPSLLQAIRATILQEESQNLQQIIRQLSVHTEPLVIVRNDGVLMYQSDCFEKIVMRSNNTLLSEVLAHTKTIKSKNAVLHHSQMQLGKRLYKIILTPVHTTSQNNASLYLIRFLRTNKIKSSIFCQLRKAGLTSRELEISVLIYQGIPTRDISIQIHLSYHTVRNHIKSIYSKMDVSTRSEMLARVE